MRFYYSGQFQNGRPNKAATKEHQLLISKRLQS